MKNSAHELARINTDYKNKLFTVFCVLLALFLTALFLIEQDQANYRENVDKMLKETKLNFKILDLKARMLKTEMGLVRLDTLLAQGNGLGYRGLINQTPTAY